MCLQFLSLIKRSSEKKGAEKVKMFISCFQNLVPFFISNSRKVLMNEVENLFHVLKIYIPFCLLWFLYYMSAFFRFDGHVDARDSLHKV